jgi:very-short-patch-repair endonuclease
MIQGNTGDVLTSPSPFQGEGGVGVTLSEDIRVSEEGNPHPNLPPKRGKGFSESVDTIYKHQPRNQTLKKHSRQLRKDMTDVERKLWYYLRRNQLGVKFRRQYPIGKYIVDFVCLEKHLVIELDGGQHALQTDYDKERDAFFVSEGFKVLRFWNNEMTENEEAVLLAILSALKHTPLPNPLPQGERGAAALPPQVEGL